MKAGDVALISGIHRCTGLGMTKYLAKGETVPQCSEGDCMWFCLKEDNTQHQDCIPLFIDFFRFFQTDELPNNGSEINLMIRKKKGSKISGSYKVLRIINAPPQADKSERIHIVVDYLGPFNETLPINLVHEL